MASTTAAGTSYATFGEPMIPFFVFYSMFGFQRVGDLIWSFGDQRGRGFLMAGTAGRTTLTGEGLQHADGHSHLLAGSVPNCRAWDPAFAYEVGTIVRDGIARMYGDAQEDCFYYVTLYNENHPQPAMPDGIEDDLLRGCYLLAPAPDGPAHRAQLLASGPMVRIALEAQRLLAEEHDVAVDVWSVPGWKQLRDDGIDATRWNRLHPLEDERVPFVQERLAATEGPIVAVTDFVRAVPEQIAPFLPRRMHALGTDGYGLSDTREALRRYFEVDAPHVAVAVLTALVHEGGLDAKVVQGAIEAHGLDADAPAPRLA